MNQLNTEKEYDVIIVGAGPAGLSFACSLIDLNLKVLVVDKSNKESISNPKPDGRETALTHNSLKIMQKLGVWDLIDQTSVSPLKEAKVFDGDSDSLLNFAAKKSSIEISQRQTRWCHHNPGRKIWISTIALAKSWWCDRSRRRYG